MERSFDRTEQSEPASNLPNRVSPRDRKSEGFKSTRHPSNRETAEQRRLLAVATFALARRHPEVSARFGLWTWQVVALCICGGLTLGGALILPGMTLAVLMACFAMPFAGGVFVRCVALVGMLSTPRTLGATHRLPDELLPTYTVLVPMYDEALVLPGLVAGLLQLDYPTDKLDIVLVLEEADGLTRAAANKLCLPAHVRILIVPNGQPRTKPKATNYALLTATGDFVVVYDAEDRPERDQLRRAAAAFAVGAPTLACVQARLNIFNPRDSWFSRQFTVEYSALFDAVLPALARLSLPVPLGGTSNHFRRQTLVAIGAWDPFNVTEDADLGVRLARQGYTTEVLASTTWEEAPVTFGQWLPQRTRWMKGWYQTYAVHSRRPRQLIRELGLQRAIGFHLFLGGLLLSTLMHPLFYLLLAWNMMMPVGFATPDILGNGLLWLLSGGTLVLGYGVSILIGVLAARRRGHGLIWAALCSPLCWLLISAASYRALWQLWRQPFLWEKTEHGRSQAARTGTT
jgi:glycosyltransferase XagB